MSAPLLPAYPARVSMCAMLLAFGGAAGCAPGFSVERHRLGPPRIAAVGVVDGALHAALWSGRGLFHDQAPRLSWSVDGAPWGEGFGVPAPAAGRVRLDAEVDGVPLVAVLSIPERPAVSPLTLSREQLRLGADLSVDARAAVVGEPVEAAVDADADARLRVEGADGRSLRWMIAGEDGGVLEVDATAADLLRNRTVYDDGTVRRGQRGPVGVYTALVLAIDGAGSNRWRWADVAMGVPGPLLVAGERLLAVDVDPPPSGLLVVRMFTDPSAGPLGLRVEAVGPVDRPEDGPPPLSCAPAGRPLRLDDLAEGWCTRADVDGLDVVLELK